MFSAVENLDYCGLTEETLDVLIPDHNEEQKSGMTTNPDSRSSRADGKTMKHIICYFGSLTNNRRNLIKKTL